MNGYKRRKRISKRDLHVLAHYHACIGCGGWRHIWNKHCAQPVVQGKPHIEVCMGCRMATATGKGETRER